MYRQGFRMEIENDCPGRLQPVWKLVSTQKSRSDRWRQFISVIAICTASTASCIAQGVTKFESYIRLSSPPSLTQEETDYLSEKHHAAQIVMADRGSSGNRVVYVIDGEGNFSVVYLTRGTAITSQLLEDLGHVIPLNELGAGVEYTDVIPLDFRKYSSPRIDVTAIKSFFVQPGRWKTIGNYGLSVVCGHDGSKRAMKALQMGLDKIVRIGAVDLDLDGLPELVVLGLSGRLMTLEVWTVNDDCGVTRVDFLRENVRDGLIAAQDFSILDKKASDSLLMVTADATDPPYVRHLRFAKKGSLLLAVPEK